MSTTPINTASLFDIREVFPYLSAFRDQRLVLTIPATMLLDERSPVMGDILLLAFSGMRLILVPDHEDVLQAHEGKQGVSRHPDNRHWIIPEAAWESIAATISLRHLQIQAALSQQIHRQDLHRQSADIHAGVYVHSRARGIYSGLDLGHNGTVRNVDEVLLSNHLSHGGIALVAGLAPSATGYLYWLSAESLSASICLTMKALKWIRLVTQDLGEILPSDWAERLSHKQGVTYKTQPPSREGLPAELTTLAIRELLHDPAIDARTNHPELFHFWQSACLVVDKGKSRMHVVRYDSETNRSNLLTELFTHHGCGLMLCPTLLESLRPANINDVGSILALTAPLEQEGTLVQRSREDIERNIEHFWITEHDERLIGCAALMPLSMPNDQSKKWVELACMAIATDERRRGLGGELLKTILKHGKQQNIERVFLLTSHAQEWFSEYGFRTASPEELPPDRKMLYENGRCSRVMSLTL